MDLKPSIFSLQTILVCLSVMIMTPIRAEVASGGYITAIGSKFFDEYKVMFMDTFIAQI